MALPHVSIIIPYYNRLDIIVETLRSVMAQTFTDWEVIVVDDCSASNPEERLRDLVDPKKLTIIRHPTNLGPAAARNTGIRAARGTFIAFLDSDDLWLPTKLQRQVETVSAQPDPLNCFCVTQTVVDSGNASVVMPRRPVNAGEHFADFLYVAMQFAQSSSFFLSRQAALSILCDEDLRQYEDHLFFVEAGLAGLHYILVPEALVVWHDDNRADRLGRTNNLGPGQLFLLKARDKLGSAASLAFEARFLGSALLRANPSAAIPIIWRAWRMGVITPVGVLKVTSKAIAPAGLYQYLRSVAVGWSSRPRDHRPRR